MDPARPLICPILVGRDDLLELGERRLAQALDGRGQLLFLAGEAGIGKSRLLAAVVRAARARGFSVAGADVGARDLEVPAGLLVDLTRSMARDETFRPLGETIRMRLAEAAAGPIGVDAGGGAARAGAAAQARRGLVADIADGLAALPGPTLLALENLHWADDLSLDILEVLAARLPERPMLVVGTYRSDELYPRTPMRERRARLVTQRLAEEARLRRLPAADTATMSSILLHSGLPASRAVVEAIQERTDGIPLHIEELLAALATGGVLDATAIDRAAVPDTIESIVRGRLERRTVEARALAEAGAVIGRSFVIDVAAGVLDRTPAEVAGPLRELVEHFFLVETGRAGLYDFRHSLIRDAIYGSVSEPDRRRMHGLAAELGADLPGAGPAFASAHYELAGRAAEAHRLAIDAARAASAMSAHREAAELYRRGLRTMPADVPDQERAAILEASADEEAATDDNEAAAAGYAAARTAYLTAGDRIAAASVTAALVGVRHLLGDDLEARTGPLLAALEDLEGPAASDAVDPADATRVDSARLRVLAGLSAAYMLDRRLEASLEHGRAARDLARRLGDRRGELHALTTMGSDLVFAGRMTEGWAALETAIDEALAAGLEEETARAYRMAGSCASVLVEYERAERYLAAGLAFAERAEMWNHQHYMAAHLAHVRWATGQWDEAEAIAGRALADGRGGITTRITARYVLGYVAIGCGDLAAAARHLDEALDLGESMRELQRRSPAMWGLAEVALAAGDTTAALAWCERGRALSTVVDDAAYLFPYLVTGTRAYLAASDLPAAEAWVADVTAHLVHRSIPGTEPAIAQAQGLVRLAAGSLAKAQAALDAAAAGWQERRRIPDAVAAGVDQAACHLRAGRDARAATAAEAALTGAEALGAVELATRARTVRDAARARHPDDVPWAPLTAREFEVAKRITDGLTNAAIGAELGISSRTVGAHVEHILAKLGVGRRAEIAAWTAARPVLHSRPHGRDREE